MAYPLPYTDTSTTNFSNLLVALVNRNIVENLRTQPRWLQPGAYVEAKIIPGTDRVRFPGYGDLTVDDSLVTTEGVPEAPEEMTIGYEDVQALQRMRTVTLTDLGVERSPHELYSIAAERVSFNALEVADFVAAKAIVNQSLSGTQLYLAPPSGSTVVLGSDQDDITTASLLDANTVKRIVALMKKDNIPTFPDGFYRAMIDPNVVYDLMNDAAVGGWIEASKYANPMQLLNGEIGRIAGVRFIESNRAEVIPAASSITAKDAGILAVNDDEANSDAGSTPWYRTVFYGPNYFSFGDLQTVRPYMVGLAPDKADPAGQFSTVSWKGMYGHHVFGQSTQVSEAASRVRILNHSGRILTGITTA